MVSNTLFLTLLPLDAYEYHGDHLPFETDWIIAEAFAKALILQTKEQFCIVLLPVEKNWLFCKTHGCYRNTSLTFSEAIKRWINIGKNSYHKGINSFLLLNAHGGNSPLMSIVITKLQRRFSILAIATSWSRFDLPQGLAEPSQQHFDTYGGFIKTSLELCSFNQRSVRLSHVLLLQESLPYP
ncbi:creatininase family protein [Bartonella sp. MM73XJBT.G]|uniref:creatininase family protein n=1 Tax=Bartonella sp. MM73XJBT.G TaxID=3019097 RepID=UPI002361A60A|nr:creatininase family protein [Bartonella sp. MM73XJBT.G]